MEIRGRFQPKLLDTQSAKEAVFFANTPTFLLDRLRKDTSVSYVASVLPTEKIIDVIRDLCSSPPKEPIDVVRAYIFLISLALKDDVERFKGKLEAIDLSSLQWGSQIRAKIIAERVPTHVTEVRFATQRVDRVSGTTSSTTGVTINKIGR
jgi:hypothetical protein